MSKFQGHRTFFFIIFFCNKKWLFWPPTDGVESVGSGSGSGLIQTHSFCIFISTGLDQYPSHWVLKSRLGQFLANISRRVWTVSFPSSHYYFFNLWADKLTSNSEHPLFCLFVYVVGWFLHPYWVSPVACPSKKADLGRATRGQPWGQAGGKQPRNQEFEQPPNSSRSQQCILKREALYWHQNPSSKPQNFEIELVFFCFVYVLGR